MRVANKTFSLICVFWQVLWAESQGTGKNNSDEGNCMENGTIVGKVGHFWETERQMWFKCRQRRRDGGRSEHVRPEVTLFLYWKMTAWTRVVALLNGKRWEELKGCKGNCVWGGDDKRGKGY